MIFTLVTLLGIQYRKQLLLVAFLDLIGLYDGFYGLMTSRYRRGDAVTPASGERNLHPHEK